MPVADPYPRIRTSLLCLKYLNEIRPLRVCRSAAGYYLGATTTDGEPLSRDSAEYWATEEEARVALASKPWAPKWTQRFEP
jgi:hypothetical protein